MSDSRFIAYHEWILEGDAVVYGNHTWPSACRWYVPGRMFSVDKDWREEYLAEPFGPSIVNADWSSLVT